jgi:ABC-2 type transport system permease protein
MYAIILVFSALVFWSPGFMFTWVFDGLFQLARYPIGLYPGWARLLLTWVIPVGVITTLPAQALMGTVAFSDLLAAIGLAFGLYLGAGLMFKFNVKRYSSASS